MGYSWQANGFVTGDLSLRSANLFDLPVFCQYGIGTIESRGDKALPGLEGDLAAEALLEDGPPGGGGGGHERSR